MKQRPSQRSNNFGNVHTTLCYAIVLPDRKSGFRAELQQDYIREGFKIGPPAGLRPAGGPIFEVFKFGIRPEPGPEARLPARKHYLRNVGKYEAGRLGGGRRSPPPFPGGFAAGGATESSNIDDFRPGSCIA